jgi:hypothetical protein
MIRVNEVVPEAKNMEAEFVVCHRVESTVRIFPQPNSFGCLWQYAIDGVECEQYFDSPDLALAAAFRELEVV